jgi:cathepsin L
MNGYLGLTRRSLLGAFASTTLLAIAGRSFATDAGAATAPGRKYSRGARVPANLAARIKAQKQASHSIDNLLRADKAFMSALQQRGLKMFAPAVSLPPAFDWRSSNRVSPIKNQGSCGSCWIFAATGAFESSFLIANKQNGTNQDGSATVDVSEQEPLDCGFADTDCITGGWHEIVLVYLQFQGEVASSTYPYKATKGLCTSNIARQFYVLNWGYVDPGASPFLVPTDQAMKEAIYRHGPIVSSVATQGWDDYWKTDENGNPNPKWSNYPGGIFTGTPTNKLKVTDINHEIVIVGWDDDAGVWLIRNSWDTSWGDAGYMKLKYGTNYIGYGSSWVAASPADSVSSDLTNQLRSEYLKNPIKSFYPSFKDLK